MVGDGFIFVDRDFPTPEKKLFKSSHCFWHSESSKKLIILLRFVFYCNYFIDKLPIISLTSYTALNITELHNLVNNCF